MRENAYEFFRSPIGTLRITANNSALLSVEFIEDAETETAKPNKITAETKRQLKEYFEGKRKNFDLPLELSGTPFFVEVWKALLEIPYGETRTYSEIAEKIGKPKAMRAVGLANNRNKIAIVIPCHRVIGKNGKLVGYAAGIRRKEWLLNLEKGNSNLM